MSSPRATRWGILATGGIAKTFVKDVLVDPNTRDVSNVKHVIAAVASSTSEKRAKDFIIDTGCPSMTRAYGSYLELVQDSEVDIVYVATPHSQHYQQSLMCLEAGKHVLCEKPMAVNVQEAEALIAKARSKQLFLMQALWTRYLPVSKYVEDVVKSGAIGTVHRCFADTSIAMHPEKEFASGEHRMVNRDLAGGALLDLGPYSLSWLFQAAKASGAGIDPVTVTAAVKPYQTGVDETTTILVVMPRSAERGGDLHGIATTSMRVSMDPNGIGSAGPCVRIQGEEGEIQVFPPSYRPTKTRLVFADGKVEDKDWLYPGPGKDSGWFNGFGEMNPEGEGHGMFWEADEAAVAMCEGRLEGSRESLDEVVAMMKVMDAATILRFFAQFRMPSLSFMPSKPANYPRHSFLPCP
ncbi:dimeric dihydrodiol dehydrogenase [Ophiobolus disseminans]|uniref:D-xylose 1-dehydrogenase (NADP(+), D-xylono-1,5-lactone-forming) n=1 Tax=Ophiobolus disseminans TaxID=1469910 RepID=A0A6A6ZIT3_9PLEO|nr:dimeric dihydrodiol dehydrogenase [Ophiobolus disseminans]